MNRSIIAIDGPAGSGKSTISKLVARAINATYIDTGAMYRGLGIHFQNIIDVSKKEFSKEENELVKKELEKINFNYDKDINCLIEINGNNLTEKIREHHVSELASQISKFPVIREYLVNFQRGLTKDRLCVMEGRDIGSVVFPDAYIKIFLTADVFERAKRRTFQLKGMGKEAIFQDVLKDIIERDKNDTQRKNSPLKKMDDSIEIDSSLMTVEEVINKIVVIYSMTN